MLLKNVQIHEASKLLNSIRITKLTDKDVKLRLVHNYLELRKASNAIMEDIQAIADKFRDDWGETLIEVRKLRAEEKEVDSKKYADFLKAEEDANGAIMEMNNGEREVDIQVVDTDAFVSCVDEDDITFLSIGYLVDTGILG